ncbi:MAG: hypothetical protein JWM05_161, partial [Acidimicrobiales bacterium]|nr:hypothetical protein [Acidimicrobiales bacterium]
LAKGAGGLVTATQTDEVDGHPRGTVTVRVPSAGYDAVVVQARRLGHVLSAEQSAADVTGEYTDVESRLKAARLERDQISLILTDAKSIPDILSVRDRLNVVQTEIETLQGRKNVLDDQTSLSTLTVSLHEKGDTARPVPTEPPARTGFSKAWHDAVTRFTRGLEAAVAGSGTIALLLLAAAALWLVGRPLYRRAQRPTATPAEPVTT